MAADACSIMYNGLATALLSSPYFDACSYPKKIAASVVDLDRVRSIDCGNVYCRSYFATFIEYAKMPTFADCTLTDESTSKRIPFKDFAVACQSVLPTSSSPPVAAPSSPSNPASQSPLPPLPPPTLPSVVHDESSNNSVTIIVAVAAVVVVGVAIAAFVYMRTRRRRPPQSTSFLHLNDHAAANPASVALKQLSSTWSNSIATAASTHPSRTNYHHHSSTLAFQSTGLDMCEIDMYRLPTSDVHLVKPLAQGAFGEVWVGDYQGSQIAIKRLLPTKSTLPDVQRFIWEIKLLSKIECPYVVHFIGVAWNTPGDMMLLTEFMNGGDLRQVLELTPTSFQWVHKLRCALSVAEGLVYLHLMDPKVIHRDLKSRNVLLDSDFNTKLTDFGIARETDDATMTAGIGTFRWMAPEVLLDGHYTEKADIFSFGVILSELSTNIVPYSDLRNDKGNAYTDTAIMAKVMMGELIPTFASDCPRWYLDVATPCLALDPLERPTAMKTAYTIRRQVEGCN
ncbi:TKL protein kinase [Aphanomyces astaci]|uniref:TKL protein kinase n=1 Tax=Aphanomyces astaci TaxID=112090 RepID=W4FT67_APHAT|nr:TKL protein kinase [Aphanomyces astaci]ETV70700.1 TKL protein kinase [Aphanomyces astaci]|eukprot:XP_009839764.1 TKL protein kinase [Aphanomyces astaci]